MKLIDNIKKPTPRKHKIAGKIVTALSVASLTIAESGIVDNRPLIKVGLQALSGIFGTQALFHAQKTLR
jgi:hypothetical protein